MPRPRFRSRTSAVPDAPPPLETGRHADDTGTNTSLEKGLAVLEALSAARHGAGVTELARTLDVPKSTIARLLMVLSSRGYVWREPGAAGTGGAGRARYRLGPRALELTANALDELLAVAQGRPHLYDLAGRTGRVAATGVLWAGVAIVVDLVEPPAATPAALLHGGMAVGRGAPAYASSIGKAILAHRPEAEVARFLDATPLTRRTDRTITNPVAFRDHLALVCERGWAANDGESTPDGTSVAAPVFNHGGEALAALAAADTHRPGAPPPAEVIAAVVDAARRVSFNLGFRPRAFR